MENRPLDQLVQNQMQEENHAHSLANCLIFYLVLNKIWKHICFPFRFCLLGIFANLLLALSPFLSGEDKTSPTDPFETLSFKIRLKTFLNKI